MVKCLSVTARGHNGTKNVLVAATVDESVDVGFQVTESNDEHFVLINVFKVDVF